MRALFPVSAILLLAIVVPVGVSDGMIPEKVLFSEIQPYGSGEGFSIMNYGHSSIDLYGYDVTDGEGTLSFTDHLFLSSGESVTIVAEFDGEYYSSSEGAIQIGTGGIVKKGSFIIANNGDDLRIERNGSVIDAVCFGDSKGSEGWIGKPVGLSSGKYLVRASDSDSDTAEDWIAAVPGTTLRVFDPDLRFDALVTPFTFPESSGIPVLQALGSARGEVLISMYMLSSPLVVSLLCELETRTECHVDVTVLLEGDVLGTDIASELSLMRNLVESGGEVFLINDQVSGNRERYSYVHAKYAVIDSETVIITSENWTSSNMSQGTGNRGWGAIIDSDGYAEYMREVFMEDSDIANNDVNRLLDYYPELRKYSGNLDYPGHGDHKTRTYRAEVIPAISPDTSFDTLRYFMERAEYRIYSEQLDIGSSYSNTISDSPVGWMADAASRGVDAKLILDLSMDSGASGTVDLINSTSGIEAIGKDGGNGYEIIHNKGVIIDDSVWLGSVNWTEGSFMKNREAAVMIFSSAVSGFFADSFMEDWGVNEYTLAQDFTITVSPDGPSANGVIVLRVNGPEGLTYVWDAFGMKRTSNIPIAVFEGIHEGIYEVTVSVDGTDAIATVFVTVGPAEGSIDSMSVVSVILGIVTAGGLAISYRNFKHGNDRQRYDRGFR